MLKPDVLVTRVVAPALVLLLFPAATALAAEPLFWPARLNHQLEKGANHTALDDFNEDGVTDVAFTAYSAGEVGVVLGRGDRSFAPAWYDTTGWGAQGVATGDVDGDGTVDLVVGHRYTDYVAVHLGRGDGTFDGFIRWPAVYDTRAVAVGDLDGDGALDVAVGGLASSSSAVLFGDGHGGVSATIFLDVESSGLSVAIGDLDGDEIPDLVFAGGFAVLVYKGLGGGSFGPPASYEVRRARSVVIGDLDGDGHADLVVASSQDDAVAVLLGNGDGTFAPATLYDAGTQTGTVVLGDFDGDGLLDVAARNWIDHEVSVHRGRGDGTLEPPVKYTVDDFPVHLAVGDVDRDGVLDLVTTGDGAISVLPGLGDGTFVPSAFKGGPCPLSVAIGDLTGNGIPDLAVLNCRDLFVLPGLGDGTFGPGDVIDVGFQSTAVAIADLDGNGVLDLAVARAVISGPQEVVVLLGQGVRTFAHRRSYDVGSKPAELAIDDLNGDDIPDIVTANRAGADVSVLLGRGDGTLEPARSFGAGTGPMSVAIGDLNDDGAPDLAVANFNSHDVSVLLGSGDGEFSPSVPYPVADYPSGVAIGDLDEDGAPDLVTTSYDSIDHEGYVTVLRGVPGGTFGDPELYDTGPYSRAPILRDFDGNGALDIACANRTANNVMMLLGVGDGTFVDFALWYGVGEDPRSIAAGDLDGDGDADLAVACYWSRDVTILLGSPSEATSAGDLVLPSPVPADHRLHRVAPNPFRATTTVRFDLSAPRRTRLDIFDVSGRRVRTLVEGLWSRGGHALVWDGRDESRRSVSPGVYFVRLETGRSVSIEKVVRVR